MADDAKKTGRKSFPSIQPEMLGRLSQEADLRTMPPQDIDWDEIHRLAEEERKKS